MLSIGSIFLVTINYQSFIHYYLLFIHIYRYSQDHCYAIAFTLLNWKACKKLWYHTAVRHYSTVQFGHHFIDFGWCNLGNQIKGLYAYAGPI